MSVGFNGIVDATSLGDLVAGLLVAPAFRVAYPYTVGIWFKGPYVETRRNDVLVNLAGRGTADSIRLDAHVGQVRHRVNGDYLYSPTPIKNNTWTHALAVGTSSTDRTVFVNGGGKAQSTVNKTPTAYDVATLGAQMTPGVNPGMVFDSSYLGRLAELAVWSAALSDEEIAEIGRGADPSAFRPDNLIYFHHLYHTFDMINGAVINQSGIGNYHPLNVFADPQDHPPIAYQPASRKTFFMPEWGTPGPIESAPRARLGGTKWHRKSASGLILPNPPSGVGRVGGAVDLTPRIEVNGRFPMFSASIPLEVVTEGWKQVYPQGNPMPNGVKYDDLAMGSNGILYAHMTGDGNKLYRSADLGATWSETTSPTSSSFSMVQCDNTGDIVVCTDGNEIYRSTNGGSTWAGISPAPFDTVYGLALSRDGTTLYASINASVYRYASGSWTNLGRPSSTGSNRLIIATNADGSLLYAATYNATAFSENAGIHSYSSGAWSKLMGFMSDGFLSQFMVTAGPGVCKTLLRATVGGSPIVIIDQGSHWNGGDLGLPYYPDESIDAFAIAGDGSVLLDGPNKIIPPAWEWGSPTYEYLGPDGLSGRPWMAMACETAGVKKMASTALIGLSNKSELWVYG